MRVPSFLVRSLTALTTVVCLITTTLAGCDLDSSGEADPLVDSRADEGADDGPEDGTELRSLPNHAVEALAADPRFAMLVETGVIMADQIVAHHAEMAPEDVSDLILALEDPTLAERVELPELYAGLGVDPVLAEDQLIVAAELMADHQLADLSPEQLQQVFELAAETPDIRDLLGLPTGDVQDPDQACLDECELIFNVEKGLLIVWYVAVLARAATMGAAGIVVALAATAALAVGLLLIFDQRETCKDACAGIIDPDSNAGECVHDINCGAGEYCYKGPLGIGTNECRATKPEGKVCSRGGQCDSGCCKFHLWTNPIAPVCRPANKC